MTQNQYEKYTAIAAELAEIKEFLWWCGKKYRKNLGGRFSTGVKVKNKKRKICVVRRWRGAIEDKVYSLPEELQQEIIDLIERYVEKREKEMESI